MLNEMEPVNTMSYISALVFSANHYQAVRRHLRGPALNKCCAARIFFAKGQFTKKNLNPIDWRVHSVIGIHYMIVPKRKHSVYYSFLLNDKGANLLIK